MKKILLLTIVMLSLLQLGSIQLTRAAGSQSPAESEVLIGVLAKRSVAICRQRWQPLADYLTENFYGKEFKIVPLTFAEIEAAVAEKRVDFILTNPAIYVNLEKKYKASRILTLVQKEAGIFSNKFGGVLFYRVDRGLYTKLESVRGHSLRAVSANSIGWLAVLLELKEKGLSPELLQARVKFTCSHDQVVYDVLAGKSDFGIVRTGILEKMAAEGRIDRDELAVIHDHGGGINHLPFLHSTRAYPEWPLAKLDHSNGYLANRVARTLLFLQPVDEAAVKAGIGGFCTALNYQPVRELLQVLQQPPFANYGKVSFRQMFWQYYHYWIALLVLLMLVFGAVIALSLINNRVRVLQKEQALTIERLHRAEADAQARSYMSQELLNAVPQPVFYLDEKHNYRGCNLAFEKFSGFTRTVLQGHPGTEFVVAGDKILVTDDDKKLLQEPDTHIREFIFNEKNAAFSLYELRISIYRNSSRQPAGLIGVLNDLTSHKLLLRQMSQLSAVVEQAAESIVITDTEGLIQYVNPAFIAITGYSQAEALGQNPSVLKSGRQDDDYYRELWETLTRGEIWHGNFVNKRKDGTFYDEAAVIFPIRNDRGEITSFAAVKRDITNEKAMQSQLRTTQRLEAVGQLAAGVAHELNTPIGFVASNFESITGYIKNFVELIELYRQIVADLAAQLPETGPPALEQASALEKDLQIEFILEDLEDLFSESRDGFERINSIVGKLREFSRIDQMDARESFNFNRAIETTMVVARNEYKYSAEVKLELDPELPDVMAAGGEINQVVLNLLVNAAQAIKEQERSELGQIIVKTDFNDEWVFCRISDNGPGIKPENLERIFDPFFTTKPVGKGTGLGLNISYDIITKKHHGSLIVESELGVGTTFVISLPRSSKNT